MTDNEQTETDVPKGGSMIGRALIVAFIGAVVMSECLFAYFWLPSSDEIAAQVKLVAQQSENNPDGDQANQGNQEALAIEVDLGAFSVTNHRLPTESTFRTDFHLWGTVLEDEQDEFNKLFQRNLNRFRNQVIEELRNSDIDALEDAGLGLIKRRFLEKSNALMGKPLLRSVVFAVYTFVELLASCHASRRPLRSVRS